MNTEHNRNDMDPQLAERFTKLREIPPRDPTRTADGRAAFLVQARHLSQLKPYPAPVSATLGERLISWMNTFNQSFRKMEMQPMFTKVMAVLIAAVLLFGGFAATAYASQGSLPNDALYGVKTFGENIRLSLASQADDKLGLALEFTQRRVEEMAALSELGVDIPPHVANQYQEQVEFTLRQAASLPDEQIIPGLERVRTHLQEQLQRLEGLHQSNPNDPALIQARDRVQEQLRLVEDGIQDPQQFRERIRTRQQQGAIPPVNVPPGPAVTPTAGQQNGNLNANGNNNQNANGNGNENANGNANENGNGNENANGNGNDEANQNGDNDHNANGDDGNQNDNGGNGNNDDGNGNDNGNDNGGNGNNNDNGNDDGNGNDDSGGNGNQGDGGGSGGGNGNG